MHTWPYIAVATDVTDDMLVYRDGAPNSTPRYKTRDNGGFSAQGDASDITSTLQDARVVAKPDASSNEKVLCTKDSASDINCQIWNGTSWSAVTEVSAATTGQRDFDVAYEQSSGTPMVCFRSNSPNGRTPNCRIWNGTDWSTTANAGDVGGNINVLRLIPDPNSDSIALLTADAGDDVNVQIWNGTAWGSITELSTNAGGCGSCFKADAAWENNSGDLLAGWFDDATDQLHTRQYSGGSWGTTMTSVITGLSTGDNVYVRLTASPDPDKNCILNTVLDDDNTLSANHWDGSSWTGEQLLSSGISGTVNASNHLFNVQYEADSNFDALITYGSTAGSLNYRIWDSATNTWGSELTLPTAPQNVRWMQLASDPVTEQLMLTTVGDSAASANIATLEWSGSAWDANWVTHTTTSSRANWNAWYAYDFEAEDAHEPTGSITAFTQQADGSGFVDITFTATDQNLHPVRAKIEYETDEDGSCDGPWAKATLTGSVTATFDDTGGSPTLDNSAAYQVGATPNRRISTALGTNTIQTVWASQEDLPTAEGTQCLRLTLNDLSDDQLTPDTQTGSVDNVAPTGLANFVSFGAAATVQHINWTPVTEANFDHYEIWYGTVLADVQGRTGTASEWDDSDYLALGTRTTMHTHITGLASSTTYYYKIWAVDTAGNEQTVAHFSDTTDAPGNTAPVTTAPSSISVATDGSGEVTFETTIQDADLEETKLRIRFSIDGGTTFYNAQITSATPDHGTVSIDVNDFQIGTTDHIDTDDDFGGSHDVTLTIVWDSKSASNQNGGLAGQDVNVILRATPRDDPGDIGLDADSASFRVDNGSPVLTTVTPIPTGTSDNTPNFTFSSTSTGTITYAGGCASATVSALSGSNTITLNALGDATYSACTITVEDPNSNTGALTIPTFTVDTTDPAGLTALVAGASTTTTQALSWTAVTETNFNHYELWFGTNQTDVQNRAGTASEWDATDDSDLSTRTTASTTITGLSPGTTYYYKIWAIDIASNEETVPDINAATAANAAPTGSLSAASQATDGTFDVHVTMAFDDANDDPLRALLEYETDMDGNCNGPWAEATLSGPVDATTDDSGGAPDLDPGGSYPLGSGTGTHIVTSAGANTVSLDWDAESDLPTADGTACLRLTANDMNADQAVPDTLTVSIDNVPPTVTDGNIASLILTVVGTPSIAESGDIIRTTWNNSAAGDNNADLASATVNLESFGGGTGQTLYDDGTNGDVTGGDDIYTYDYTVVDGTISASGLHVHVTAVDDAGNETTGADSSSITVNNVSPTGNPPATESTITTGETGGGRGSSRPTPWIRIHTPLRARGVTLRQPATGTARLHLAPASRTRTNALQLKERANQRAIVRRLRKLPSPSPRRVPPFTRSSAAQ